jgi:uncharacterized membrane protein
MLIAVLAIIFIIGLVLLVSDGYTPANEAADILEEKMRLDGLAMVATDDATRQKIQDTRALLSATTRFTRPGKNDDSSAWINQDAYRKGKSI